MKKLKIALLVTTAASAYAQSQNNNALPTWCPENRCDRMQHYPAGTKVFWNRCMSRYRCKRHCYALKPNDRTKYTLFSGSKSRYAPPMMLGEPLLVCQTPMEELESNRDDEFADLMNFFDREKTSTVELTTSTVEVTISTAELTTSEIIAESTTVEPAATELITKMITELVPEPVTVEIVHVAPASLQPKSTTESTTVSEPVTNLTTISVAYTHEPTSVQDTSTHVIIPPTQTPDYGLSSAIPWSDMAKEIDSLEQQDSLFFDESDYLPESEYSESDYGSENGSADLEAQVTPRVAPLDTGEVTREATIEVKPEVKPEATPETKTEAESQATVHITPKTPHHDPQPSCELACENGGICRIISKNNRICQCSSSIFFGKFCQNRKQTTTTTSPKTTSQKNKIIKTSANRQPTPKEPIPEPIPEPTPEPISSPTTEKFVLQQYTDADYDYTSSTPKELVIPPIMKVTTNEIVTEQAADEDGHFSDWVDYDTDDDELNDFVVGEYKYDDSLPGLSFDAGDSVEKNNNNTDLDTLGLYDSGIEGSGKGLEDYNLDDEDFYEPDGELGSGESIGIITYD